MSPPLSSAEAQVLIVGGRPVGLSLAIGLSLRGIKAMLVEQRSRTGAQPRAKTTNVRSMEHMRHRGVADALRAAAPLPPDYPTDIVFSTALFGRTLTVIENAFAGAKRRDPRFPEPTQWVPQYTVEEVLRERIARLPSVQFALGTTLEDLAQSDQGVTATVSDAETGVRRAVRAEYLVGADSARSRVRQLMDARMEGEHALTFNYNVILRIPGLERTPPTPRAIMYWIVNPGSPAVLSPLERDGRWAFGIMLPPACGSLTTARSSAACKRPSVVPSRRRSSRATPGPRTA